ncbi:hypothetical protein NE857_00325 [Nocardiopsis exhalans]|uniref:Apea-like HEPN domain-containing protein n=1 Tax=Nocardiopsis exhalans TaxID=163604 RepID=A0ABY5DAX3_9ACTN|nr:hypothetical protein [Nocardiopsis exhalans]USY20165.1 hypothetical protein NE857_00325 [Nocardiopsis exhalans]
MSTPKVEINKKDEQNPNSWNSLIEDFAAQMFDLLHIGTGFLSNIQRESDLSDQARQIMNLLTEEEKEEMRATLDWIGDSLLKFHRTEEGPISPLPRTNQEGQEGQEGQEESSTLELKSANVSTALMQLLTESRIFMRSDIRPETLRKSILITSASTFEMLFGRMAERVYKVNKSALDDSEYKFSLQQLAEFETLDDAREFLTERRISALLRESIEGWEKWLSKSVKGTSMTSLSSDWDGIREVFARRNVIVHNGGYANHIYLKTAKGSKSKKVALGEELKVDEDYFSERIQGLLSLGIITSADVARRLHKEESENIADLVFRYAQISLRRGAWDSAISLSEYSLKSKINRRQQLRSQIINWTAKKKLFGLEKIESEVSSWDVSGLSDEFSHCKLVLLGKNEEAAKSIELLVESKKLSVVDIATDPLYDEARELLEIQPKKNIEKSNMKEAGG